MKNLRLYALLMALVLVVSVILLAACSDKDDDNSDDSSVVSEEESQTPEEIYLPEKFANSLFAIYSSFSDFGNTLGLDPKLPTDSEEKIKNTKLDVTLKELLMGDTPQIPGPSGLSIEFYSTDNAGKGVLSAFIGEEVIPGEFFVGQDDLFVSLDKLTPLPLKIPFMGAIETLDLMENLVDMDTGEMSDTLQEYMDLFMDHFEEDMFTSKTETLVIDEVAYEDALHISFKPTEKQLLEAVLTVLNKAKNDTKIKMFISNLVFADPEGEEKQKEFEAGIAEAIEDVTAQIENSKENSYLDFSSVEKDGKLISLFAVFFEEGKENGLFRLTNVTKSGTDVMKIYSEDEDSSTSFTWEQTANDKGSADGVVLLTTEDEEESNTVKIEYAGSKDNNALTIESDFEIIQLIESYEITYAFGLNLSYTPKEEGGFGLTGEFLLENEEMKLLLDVAIDISLIDYSEIELPDPKDTIPVDENFDASGIFQGMEQEYPVFYQYLMGLLADLDDPDLELEYEED